MAAVRTAGASTRGEPDDRFVRNGFEPALSCEGPAGGGEATRMSNRTALVAVAAALALALAGVAGVATGHVVVASPVVVDTGTTLYETANAGFAFANRSYSDLPLSSSINVVFFDADIGPHTFTLINISNFWLSNYSSYPPTALVNLVHTHGYLVSANASGNGYNRTEHFTSPSSAGYYLFVCMISGHFEEGMWGVVAFGENVPANISFGSGSPGPGLAVFIIIGTIVALTVLAIVLGFVIGQRRGAEHEMPPERLGYAEPPTSEPQPLPPARPPHP
jgi:hypothetical protein